GWDLQTVLEERGALPMREAIQHILQACEGLAEAHGLGIVHRDLKPENLYLATTPEGAVLKILDFGISKDIAPSIQPGRCSTLTKDGSAVGSPYYMSPEQMRASPSLDARADIWSLGAILFELLTGQCPFEADTPAQLCTKVLVDDAPSLRELFDRAPVELDEIVRRCLQKDPRARFQTVTELADALRELIASTERAATERAAAERAATERAATERAATERFDLASLTVDSERKPSSGPQSGARHPLEAALAEPTPTNFTPVRLSSAGLPRRRHAAWVAASAVLAIAVVAYFELRGDWVTPEWLTGRHANVAAVAPKVAPPPADELNQQAQPRPVVSVVVSPPPSATVAEIAPTNETKVIAATPARPSATHPASAPQRSPQGPKYYIPPVRREPSQREPEPAPASPAPDNPETRYGL
ncbi:MAG TPA: serine/threonine-protein kinase, partial [Polyangiaceae bacterium]